MFRNFESYRENILAEITLLDQSLISAPIASCKDGRAWQNRRKRKLIDDLQATVYFAGSRNVALAITSSHYHPFVLAITSRFLLLTRFSSCLLSTIFQERSGEALRVIRLENLRRKVVCCC
jgi:hypothetical protein